MQRFAQLTIKGNQYTCKEWKVNEKEIECLEHQIEQWEGKTEKLKNPNKPSDLKRYIWAIAKLSGWKAIPHKESQVVQLLGGTSKILRKYAGMDAF